MKAHQIIVWLSLGLNFLIFPVSRSSAQSIVSGIVISHEDGYPMEGVAVSSYFLKTGVLTDYQGRYSLKLAEEDTLIISFLGFKDQKFPIHGGWNTHYTINASLEILPVLLKNLNYTVQRDFRDDSLQNREEFKGIFNYKRPTLVSYQLPVMVVNDLNHPANVFGFQGPQFSGGLAFSLSGFYSRFLRAENDRYLHFKRVLEKREKDTYVKNYFNPVSVHAITGLSGKELDFFIKHYEPKFKSISGKSDYDIQMVIKESFLRYKNERQASLSMPSKMN